MPEHPDHVLDQLLAVDAEYTRAGKAYEGTLPEVFASEKLRHLLAGTGKSYRVNFARTPCDVLLERLAVDAVTHPTAQAVVDDIYADNPMGFEIPDILQRASVFGDAYAIVWTDDEQDSGVAVYGHDPRTVRVFYDPSRPRRKTHAIQVWEDGDHYRYNLYLPDRVERYVSLGPVDGVALSEQKWVEYSDVEGEDFAVPNPLPGRLPVFHFRNQRQYGRPEHKDAFGPQEMINKIAITMMASIDYAGFPQRYALVEESLNPDPADDFGPLPEGSLTDAADYSSPSRRRSEFDASPGATWLLSGTKAVGQFATANTDNFLKPYQSLIQSMAAVTDTPMHYFDLSGGMPSGESFRAANAPLDKKARHRQDTYGVELNSMFDYAVALRGAGPGTQVTWRPVEQVTGKEFWDMQAAKTALGMPTDVAFQEAATPPHAENRPSRAGRQSQHQNLR